MCPQHHKYSVPLALSEFSAPGTFNVQCPWHFQCSMPLALSMFTAQFSSPAWVDSGTTSLYRLPVHHGMELELPSLLWSSLHSSTFPMGMEWIVVRQVPVSPNGNWAESSSTDCYSTNGVCNDIAHCLMSACQPHCECCTFASVLYGKKSFFVWLLLLATSQLTCASWWCCLPWGWLSNVTK